MITAVFEKDNNFVESESVWQWDYGQALSVYGLNFPETIEAHIGIERGRYTVKQIVHTEGDVATIEIPNILLQQPRNLMVYLYVVTEKLGKTEKIIRVPVMRRAKPDGLKDPEDLMPVPPGRPSHNECNCNCLSKEELMAIVYSAKIYADRAELAEKSTREIADVVGCLSIVDGRLCVTYEEEQ